mgnify:CR=1 FL=1
MRLGTFALIALLVVQYEVMNTPQLFNANAFHTKAEGEVYKSKASVDEVIISSDMEIDPQTIFYAGRNIRYEKDTADAVSYIKNNNRKKAVFIKVESSIAIDLTDNEKDANTILKSIEIVSSEYEKEIAEDYRSNNIN